MTPDQQLAGRTSLCRSEAACSIGGMLNYSIYFVKYRKADICGFWRRILIRS